MSVDYTSRPLGPETWDAYAALIERHNGVWGGCWCLEFHVRTPDMRKTYDGNRIAKRRLVDNGEAHAAVVFDGELAVGWCQYGTPEELPRITHRKEYEAGMDVPADYRITCFFVDRDHRRSRVATVALNGAIALIAEAGGGIVDGFPYDTGGGKVNSSFLYNGTRDLFSAAGFEYQRPKGKNHCVMRLEVPPA